MKTKRLVIEKEVGVLLKKHGKTISVAESCTGGLISHRITNVPGSSEYYDRGVISYSNQSKMDILHVSAETLLNFGAVSRQTAAEMAQGIKQISKTDFGLAASGIAGPGGGSAEKPVGLVYVCLATDDDVICNEYRFKGNREEIKFQTSQAALEMLKKYLLTKLTKRKT
jgi:nicotinamide-nucleotide amidase